MFKTFLRIGFLGWTFFGGTLFLNAQFTHDDFQRADRGTVRLHPSEFSELPSALRTELERRGCTIPQPYNAHGEKQNVVSGQFTSSKETDWAVLCSRNGKSAVLLFHGGRPGQGDETGEEPDMDYLQVVGRQIGYCRRITKATADTVRRYGGREVDHDGLEDSFLEKGSVIWFVKDDKWLKLSGSD